VSKLTLTKAFADYGAVLKNARWACSAIAKDGSLVFSCWDHFLRPQPGGSLRYEDALSRWRGNVLGREVLREQLKQALESNLRVRLVIASLKEPSIMAKAHSLSRTDASIWPKTFSTRKDLVGRVAEFNGDRFVIDYHREGTS